MDASWKNMRGFRFILQPRYYMGINKGFFLAPEFRLKQYSFDDQLTLVNKATGAVLSNYEFPESQVLVGGAIVAGQQVILSKKNHLVLEITAGIGAKQRFIKRKQLPGGYDYYPDMRGFGLAPHYEYNNDGTPYFPAALRIIWMINASRKLIEKRN